MSPKRESQHESEISINFAVYAYTSKILQMESNTLMTRIINNTQFAHKAAMCFEYWTVFGRLGEVELHYSVSV